MVSAVAGAGVAIETAQKTLRKLARHYVANDILYHYTSPSGFEGIVSSGKFRGTHIAYMNDFSEYQDGLSIAVQAAQGILDSGVSSIVRRYLEILISELQGLRPKDYHPFFIGCFSSKEDDLSQWRAYSKLSGFSIGFSAAQLQAQLAAMAPRFVHLGLMPPVLLPVLYDRSTKVTLAKEFLVNMSSILEKRAASSPHAVEELIREWVDTTHVVGALFIPIMKSEKFTDEAEHRLIYLPSSDAEIRFLAKEKSLSGYVDLPITANERLPLLKVWVGPSDLRDLNELAAIAMLRRFGYPASVHISQVSARP